MKARRARWAVSLADLSLILLTFFVLLRGVEESTAVIAARSAFSTDTYDPILLHVPGASLFEPSEARLRSDARRQLRAIGARTARGSARLVVESIGQDASGRRFDAWELAAARAAAVAHALTDGGMPQDRIRIAMPPARTGHPSAQTVTVRTAD